MSPSLDFAISEIRFSALPTVNSNSVSNLASNSLAHFLIGGATAPEE